MALENYALDFGPLSLWALLMEVCTVGHAFVACVAVLACWLFAGGGVAATDAYMTVGVAADDAVASFAELQMQMAHMMARQAKVFVNFDLDKLLQDAGLKVNYRACGLHCVTLVVGSCAGFLSS